MGFSHVDEHNGMFPSLGHDTMGRDGHRLKSQITRVLNKPGVFGDLAFQLMQDGFSWGAWCHSCDQLTPASVEYERMAMTRFFELPQCTHRFAKWDHFCFSFALKFCPLNCCVSGADSQATQVSLQQDCPDSWGGVTWVHWGD